MPWGVALLNYFLLTSFEKNLCLFFFLGKKTDHFFSSKGTQWIPTFSNVIRFGRLETIAICRCLVYHRWDSDRTTDFAFCLNSAFFCLFNFYLRVSMNNFTKYSNSNQQFIFPNYWRLESKRTQFLQLLVPRLAPYWVKGRDFQFSNVQFNLRWKRWFSLNLVYVKWDWANKVILILFFTIWKFTISLSIRNSTEVSGLEIKYFPEKYKILTFKKPKTQSNQLRLTTRCVYVNTARKYRVWSTFMLWEKNQCNMLLVTEDEHISGSRRQRFVVIGSDKYNT